MMYYIKPLTPDEIYHNFLINKNRYSLVDCEECENCDDGCIDCELPTPPTPPPTPQPLSCPVTDFSPTTTSTCGNKSYAGVFDIDPVTYDFYINPLTLYTGEDYGPASFWQNAPFGNWFFEFANDDLLSGNFDLEEACYAGSPDSRYCTGIENGGTHWMWYPTVITVSYNGLIQYFGVSDTWTDIINYLDSQGAPVDNTMTLEEVNALNPDDLTVSLSGMDPCLCD